MSKDYQAIVITPEAWNELYAMLKPFITELAAWGVKHEQPVSVPVGVIWGAAEITHRLGNGCTCPVCEATVEAIADELVDRMLDSITSVRH